ncbi:hypothetical protein B0H65DRAFT_418773, partial [Neurospora tetraspora]
SSSRTKISASERPSTSSTSYLPHPLLRVSKKLDALFFDPSPNQGPEYSPNRQLPHRTSSAVLPLTEEESRRPRQIAQGSVSYRHRPP